MTGMDDLTDRQALEQLLTRFGLTPATTDKAEEWNQLGAVCLAAKQGGVEGYDGFITVFQFDADGKFQSVHLWE
jgi:hypothetical protein